MRASFVIGIEGYRRPSIGRRESGTSATVWKLTLTCRPTSVGPRPRRGGMMHHVDHEDAPVDNDGAARTALGHVPGSARRKASSPSSVRPSMIISSCGGNGPPRRINSSTGSSSDWVDFVASDGWVDIITSAPSVGVCARSPGVNQRSRFSSEVATETPTVRVDRYLTA
jgi:hypothetical protein